MGDKSELLDLLKPKSGILRNPNFEKSYQRSNPLSLTPEEIAKIESGKILPNVPLDLDVLPVDIYAVALRAHHISLAKDVGKTQVEEPILELFKRVSEKSGLDLAGMAEKLNVAMPVIDRILEGKTTFLDFIVYGRLQDLEKSFDKGEDDDC